MLSDNAPSWLFADPYAYQYSDLSSHASKAHSSENMPGSSAAVVGSPVRRTSYYHAAAVPTRDASQAPELYVPPAPKEPWSSFEPVMPRSPYHHIGAMNYSENIEHAADTSLRHSTLEVVAAPVTPSKPKSALNFDEILQGVEREKTKLGFKTWEIERARGRRARASHAFTLVESSLAMEYDLLLMVLTAIRLSIEASEDLIEVIHGTIGFTLVKTAIDARAVVTDPSYSSDEEHTSFEVNGHKTLATPEAEMRP